MQIPSTKDVMVPGKMAVEIPPELQAFFPITNNLTGVIPRLQQIGILHSAQMFKMPDESKVEAFQAVIMDQHAANAWWEKPATEESGTKVPDCFSMDGIVPSEDSELMQNKTCKGCKQNEYGSDPKGNGKACKNMKRLHVIMEGSLLPRRFTVPPSSLRSFDTYMTSLFDKGLPYACVVTEFLLKEKKAGTNVYSEVVFSRNRVLVKDELYKVAEFIKKFQDAAANQEIRADEYQDAEKVEQTNNNNEPPPVDENDIPF